MKSESVSLKKTLTLLSGRQVEVFYVLLVCSGKYSFLPELYDIFGRESTIKFLELFSGCRFYVPKVEKLEKLARKAEVYVRIEQVSAKQKPSVIRSIAEEYDLTEDFVRQIYVDAKVDLEDGYGFKVIKKGQNFVKKI